MKRSCGVLMPVTALPSPYGIGTLGQAAFDFVDFLAEAGQSYWQVLPLGHTSYGDSPYQCFSTYAGNPYMVDLDILCKDGLLEREEILALDWGENRARVDYGAIYANRYSLLAKAALRGWEKDAAALAAFREENRDWLEDYALFMALKRRFAMRAWYEWPDADIRMRKSEALMRCRKELDADVRLFTYIQFLFFRQWEALRAYAAEKGVGIIGDLAIYVALDSADVWAEPEGFQLDESHMPVEIAGVPPDYFNAGGQLWGNPLYDWEAMCEDGYGWWLRRIRGASRLYDVLRIDHFRGFESYWAVPRGETTARNGRWVKGPGMDLVGLLRSNFPDMEFIAEDLGYPSPAVAKLLADSGMLGMKVLQFAFDSRDTGSHMPHSYTPHCVCYPGTHDNIPLAAWMEEADPADVDMAVRYLGLNREEGFHWGFIRGGMSSAAVLFVAQLQDYLGLGTEGRMNAPGVLGGNWQWRMQPGQCSLALAKRMADMAKLYDRAAK